MLLQYQCASLVLLLVRPAWFLTTVSTLRVATVPVCFIGVVTCEACMVPHNSFHSMCCYSTSVLHWCCYLCGLHGSSQEFPLYVLLQYQCASLVLLLVRPAWFLTTVSTLRVATVPVCFIGVVTCEACMVPHNSFHSTCCYSTSVLHWCCYL